jgi:hypothetical protein
MGIEPNLSPEGRRAELEDITEDLELCLARAKKIRADMLAYILTTAIREARETASAG